MGKKKKNPKKEEKEARKAEKARKKAAREVRGRNGAGSGGLRVLSEERTAAREASGVAVHPSGILLVVDDEAGIFAHARGKGPVEEPIAEICGWEGVALDEAGTTLYEVSAGGVEPGVGVPPASREPVRALKYKGTRRLSEGLGHRLRRHGDAGSRFPHDLRHPGVKHYIGAGVDGGNRSGSQPTRAPCAPPRGSDAGSQG